MQPGKLMRWVLAIDPLGGGYLGAMEGWLRGGCPERKDVMLELQ